MVGPKNASSPVLCSMCLSTDGGRCPSCADASLYDTFHSSNSVCTRLSFSPFYQEHNTSRVVTSTPNRSRVLTFYTKSIPAHSKCAMSHACTRLRRKGLMLASRSVIHTQPPGVGTVKITMRNDLLETYTLDIKRHSGYYCLSSDSLLC